MIENRYLDYKNTVPHDEILNSKILVVGAGGIGSELLKNLVLCGFGFIEIIDLDTIDVSNLNRQFLFRQEHVGKSKAEVAQESALRMNPNVTIVAHHGNVKSRTFDVEFFQKFSVVMNALDNVSARQHVNRMCLKANVPLIDGGTAGYLGQVMTIVNGKTECYECQPKPTQKSFAICTIRSNPSTMVHCVVWAKQLFERLFGKATEGNTSEEYDKINAIEDDDKWLETFFNLVFKEQIEEVTKMKDVSIFAKGIPPQAFDFKALLNESLKLTEKGEDQMESQVIWNVRECAEHLVDSSKKLRTLKKEKGDLTFDKDDDLPMEFVAAAANMRASNFNLENRSLHDCQGKAGNIVPAIATSNAIIAGIMVLETFKVLKEEFEKLKTVFLMRNPSRYLKTKDCFLYPNKVCKPNPNCFVCSSSEVTVNVNVDITPLGYFVKELLQGILGLEEPSVVFASRILYESGEDLEDDEREEFKENEKKFLKDFDIVNYSEVNVEDYVQDIEWKVIIRHDPKLSLEESNVGEQVQRQKQDHQQAKADGPLKLVIVLTDDEEEESRKRKRNGEVDASEPPLKKAKEDSDDDIQMIMLD